MNDKLNRYIYLNERSLSHDLCKVIIELFNKEPNKVPGRTLGGINPNTKKNNRLLYFTYIVTLEKNTRMLD